MLNRQTLNKAINAIKRIGETLKIKPNSDRLSEAESASSFKFTELYRLLLPHAKKHRRLALGTGVLTAISGLIAWPIPLLQRYLVDDVLVLKNWDELPWVVGLIILMAGTEQVIRLVMQVFSARLRNLINLSVKSELLRLTLSFPKSFFDKVGVGYIMERITQDVAYLCQTFSIQLFQMSIHFLKLFGGIVFLFYLEWQVGLISLVCLPAYYYVILKFHVGQFALAVHSSEQRASTSEKLKETMSNITLIKGSAGESQAASNLEQKFFGIFRLDLDMVNLNIVFNFLIDIVPHISRLMLLVFGSIWVIRGDWSLGSLWASYRFLEYVLQPAGAMANFFPTIQQAKASASRINVFHNLAPEENLETGIKVGHLKGSVKFDNVSFGYDRGKPVLHDLSFEVQPGETIAIVGGSGTGKSTLAALLMCFYKPQSGDILFDGKPSYQFNLRNLRSRIAFVNQTANLFSGSLVANIAYLNQSATKEEVKEYFDTVGGDDILASMPGGLDTYLEEEGKNLSVGQRQRLTVAREMLKRPDIMILDEPTASLDTDHEESIIKGIQEKLGDKTVFIVSHRQNVASKSDKVLFMSGGRVAGFDTHQELKETNPEYRRFFSKV